MDTGEAVAATVLEIGQFYELLEAHLESAFGRRHPVWLRGEVAKIFEKGHLYVDLAGQGGSDGKRPVLNAHCWNSQWGRLKSSLAADGVSLSVGAVVSVFGYVDLYAPQGKIGFTVTDIDAAGLIGDVARRRTELISRLDAAGLLEANKTRPMAPVALKIGLVASPGTEGYNDFTGQLLSSGYSFDVRLVRTLVQGEAAPAQIVAAVADLDERGCDVICIVRGGGSKGDLAGFDDERVARAIAGARTPIWTGIGHTGDESVADLVAHTRAITPTKLGEELVARVREWRERHVLVAAQQLRIGAVAVLEEGRILTAQRRRTMVFAVRDRLRSEERHLVATRERIDLQSRRVLESADATLRSTRQLLGAYDPARRLAQGWSVVTTRDGTIVQSIHQAAAGSTLHVRVSDGTIVTNVTATTGE